MDRQSTCPNCDAPAQERDAYCGQCGAALRAAPSTWNWPEPPANEAVNGNGNGQGNGHHSKLDVTETEELAVSEAPATDTAVEPDSEPESEPQRPRARRGESEEDMPFVPLGVPVQLDPPQPGGLRRLLPLGRFRQG